MAAAADEHRHELARAQLREVRLELRAGLLREHAGQEGAGLGQRQHLLEEPVGLDHLDPQDLQKPPEPSVLVPGAVAEEDVVEEQLLHHGRDHQVHFGPRLVDEHPPQPPHFGSDVNHGP